MPKCNTCQNLRRDPIWCAYINDCPYVDLERECDDYRRMTNADKIRAMSDEELTKIILCPYDTAGKPIDIMPCVKDGSIQELVPPEDCKKCMLEWLQSEVEE